MNSGRLITRLSRIDWDFSGSFSESPFSRIHWHPARYASQLPAALIGLLTRPGEIVVDPFVGSGTTLVEAQRLGRQSIGIDIHPVSCLISKCKTIALPAKRIVRTIGAIRLAARRALDRQLRFDSQPLVPVAIPRTVQAKKWYTKGVAKDLARLWTLKADWKGVRKIIADAAFSAILLNVCRETRHWGYVCDNTDPEGDHGGDVLGQYLAVLDKLAMAYELRDQELAQNDNKVIVSAEVHEGDARAKLRAIADHSVDLILTSPPYAGVVDYIKAQRLTMEWIERDIEPLRLAEIGARSKRHRTTSTQEYVSGIGEVFQECWRCLKPSGWCVLVVGQSSSRAPILGHIRAAMADIGFKLELDRNRRVSSQRRLAPSIRGEHVLILSK